VTIQHVTVVSPERALPLSDVTVEIRNGRITRIAATRGSTPSDQTSKVKTIDGRGLYLIPGLIDSHVHLGEIPGMMSDQEQRHADIGQAARQQIPRSFLYYGFTTLIDLNSTPDSMARWKEQDPAPDMYFCGAAPLLDGYPTNFSPKPDRYKEMPNFIVETGADAALPAGMDAASHTPEAVVARIKGDGAICVKTFFERGFDPQSRLPVPRLATIQALVRAAHAEGLPVLLHANSTEAQKFGVDAGVDILAHGLWNWNEEESAQELTPSVQAVLDRVTQMKVGWQPTGRVMMGLRDLLLPSFLSNPLLPRVLPSPLIDWYRTDEGQSFHNESLSRFLAIAGDGTDDLETKVKKIYQPYLKKWESTTRYMGEHHGRLLFGTDTPCAPIYSNPPGLNGWWEIQALKDAGVTPAQIFRAATLENAQALKLDKEIGTVQVGKWANLLLVRADPTRTTKAYAGIVRVILRGRVLNREDLTANRN
jgi:imidazolonepropionase-like amidohydrolase